MHNVLKYRKIFQNRRNGCGLVAVIFSIYLCSVLYFKWDVTIKEVAGNHDQFNSMFVLGTLAYCQRDVTFEEVVGNHDQFYWLCIYLH